MSNDWRERFDKREFRVGDKLWMHFGEGYRAKRAAIDTLVVDGKGYTSPGRLWYCQEDVMEEAARNEAWYRLHQRMGSYANDDVPIEDIRQAANLLRVEIEE